MGARCSVFLTLRVDVCPAPVTLLTATDSPIVTAVHFIGPLLLDTRVSPAFHLQQMLLQSFLLIFVHCPLAVRDMAGNGNQGQSPQCLHFLSPCVGPVWAHGQQPSQLQGCSRTEMWRFASRVSALLLTQVFAFSFAQSPTWNPVPKQVKAGSPSLSSAPQPGILSTISLNRGNEVLPLPGPPSPGGHMVVPALCLE